MSLGLFKKTSKSNSSGGAIHRYENVPPVNVSSQRHNGTQKQCRKHDADYINVQFEDKNGKRRLARLGEMRRQSIDSDLSASATCISNSKDSTDGVRQHHKVAKYNRLKLKKSTDGVGGQHRTERIDSDSSSSEIEESSENADAKEREIEHYNRLKLNISCLPHNKKALKGIKILYNDSLPVEEKQQLPLQAALNSSALFKQRQQLNITEETKENSPASEEEEERSTIQQKYKKEGHTNHLFSVTGRPIRCSRSFVWNRTSSSKSIGDVSGAHADHTDFQKQLSATSNKTSKTAARRSNSFSNIETMRAHVATCDHTQPSIQPTFDTPSTPIQPSLESHTILRDKPAIEMNSDSSVTLSPAKSKAKPQQRSESLGSQKRTFDRENISKQLSISTEAEETQTIEGIVRPLQANKPIKKVHVSRHASLHNEACPMTCHYSRIRFVNAIETIMCDHNGGQYTSESHDIRITIPKGAIKKRITAELQVGVTLHGPFSFPDTKRPVSPILWVGINPPNIKLKKPIEITMPHFVERSSQSPSEESSNLVFLKTTDTVKATHTGKKCGKKYQFCQVAESSQQFNSSDNHGTVLTKELCLFCIAGDIGSNSNLIASYCLLPVIPKLATQTTWKIHYYITYLLKTYIHMVQCQVSHEWEILPPRKFNFATAVEGWKQARIEIQFKRQLADSGWILSLESNNKIKAGDLDLWGDSGSKMEILESIGMYPPRFTIRVHSEEARTSSVAIIHFSGVTEDLTTEIPLLRTRMSISTTNPSTPTSSLFSPNQTSSNSYSSSDTHQLSAYRQTSVHGLGCTCTECLMLSEHRDYDHLPSMEGLGQTQTYHNGQTDTPTDDELLRIATKVIEVLQENWAVLQAPLNIPDYVMLDVLSQTTLKQQVFRLLKEWCKHTRDCSMEKLVQCLYHADRRLYHVGATLQQTA